METHLGMNGVKVSNSFNVKDLLNLPTETKAGSCSPVSSDGTMPTSGMTLAHVPEMAEVTHTYYDTDNPYTRWLQTNETMQYSGKFHQFFSTDLILF